MRHKKIPSKNRKKLKQVDPFNKKGAQVREEAKKKLNRVPKDLDDQPLSKSLLELKESQKLNDKKEVKRKKKETNLILLEAKKAGLEKGRFEGIQQFVRRIERTVFRDIDEHHVKMKQGLTGRAQAEIDADMKLLEDKEKRQKEQKKREIQNKIVAAREERERKAKAIVEREEAKQKRKEEREKMIAEREKERLRMEQEAEEEEEEDEQEEEMEQDNEEKVEDEEDDEGGKPRKKNLKPFKKSEKPAKRAEKARALKEIEQKTKRNESLLNSVEIIRFGERYDEPPSFSGGLKKEFDPLFAKAGGKNLLLSSMLKK